MTYYNPGKDVLVIGDGDVVPNKMNTNSIILSRNGNAVMPSIIMSEGSNVWISFISGDGLYGDFRIVIIAVERNEGQCEEFV